MKEYLELCQRLIDHGEWVENSRTGKRCLTIINAERDLDVVVNEIDEHLLSQIEELRNR